MSNFFLILLNWAHRFSFGQFRTGWEPRFTLTEDRRGNVVNTCGSEDC